MSSAILVVGDVTDDIVVRPLTTVTAGSDTPAHIQRSPGGSAANTAAWLGRLSVPVRFVGRVGREDVDRHRDDLRRHGVDAHLGADSAHPTATIVITLDGHGERSMYVDRGANAGLVAGDVPADAWQDLGWLHLTGYSFFDPRVRPVVQALVARARDQQIPWSIDPCSTAYLHEVGRDSFLQWTFGGSIAFPNVDEAALLTGLREPVEMAAALTRYYDAVVVTCGADGAVAATRSGQTAGVRAVEVETIDPTGAGDAFTAGFLAARIGGDALPECLARGAAVAQDAVSCPGGRPA